MKNRQGQFDYAFNQYLEFSLFFKVIYAVDIYSPPPLAPISKKKAKKEDDFKTQGGTTKGEQEETKVAKKAEVRNLIIKI